MRTSDLGKSEEVACIVCIRKPGGNFYNIPYVYPAGQRRQHGSALGNAKPLNIRPIRVGEPEKAACRKGLGNPGPVD